MPPASIANHPCIGSVYVRSTFNASLTRLNGVVPSSGDDWTPQAVVGVFMVAIVCLGLAAALAGRWLGQIGPPVVGTIAAAVRGDSIHVLRTGRTEWNSETIPRTYWRITDVELTFRSIKPVLGLRPIFHQFDRCIAAHLFIAVPACHAVHLIRTRLASAFDRNRENPIHMPFPFFVPALVCGVHRNRRMLRQWRLDCRAH